MRYTRDNPPVPAEMTPDLIALEDKWNDKFTLIPTDGFLHDFYLYTLGWQVTNLYAFWSGVAGLSALANRQVKLKSAMDTYPNFYVILVGPPGVAKKSTAMKLWENIEDDMWSFLPEYISERKNVPIVASKATSEFLFTQMANKELDSGEKSDAILKVRVSELDNFLSLASYNSTLVSKLTDFYDCKKRDTDGVIGRNKGKLAVINNIYATMFGCTTPMALKETLPKEAFGGGFISRCTFVNQEVEDLTRKIPWPYFHEDAPDQKDLSARLAWIAINKNGVYSLTDQAMSLYEQWYDQVYIEIMRKAKEGNSDDRDSRITVQALKLATLLAYQRYDLEKRVTYLDMLTAVNIIDWTMRSSTGVLDEASLSLGAEPLLLKFHRDVESFGPNGVDQRTLCRKKHYKVSEVNSYFYEMKARGLMEMTVKKIESPNLKGGFSNRKFYKTIHAES